MKSSLITASIVSVFSVLGSFARAGEAVYTGTANHNQALLVPGWWNQDGTALTAFSEDIGFALSYAKNGDFGIKTVPDGNYPSGSNEYWFPSKYFRLGRVGDVGRSWIIVQTSPSKALGFPNEGLFLERGAIHSWWDNPAAPHRFLGKVTLKAPEAVPFEFHTDKKNTIYQFTGDFSGAAGTAAYVRNGFSPVEGTYLGLYLSGTADNFFGTLTFEPHTLLKLGPVKVGGSVIFQENTALSTASANDVAEIAHVRFANGQALTFADDNLGGKHATNSILIVGNEDAFADVTTGLSIRMGIGDWWEQNKEIRYPIMRFKNAAEVPVEKFTCSTPINQDVFLPKFDFVVTPDPDGQTKTLSLVRRKYMSFAGQKLNYQGDTFFWGDAVDPDADFYQNPPSPLNTPTAETAVYGGRSINFPYKGSDIRLKCDDLTIGSMLVYTNITVGNWGGYNGAKAKSGLHVRGQWTVLPPKFANRAGLRFYEASDRRIFIDVDFLGAGNVVLTADKQSATTKGLAYYTLTGDSSAFKGSFVLDRIYEYSALPDEICHVVLEVSAAEQLGGPLDAFKKDALYISNYGVVKATDSFTFDTVHRGILLEGLGSIEVVDGKVLTVGNTLTLAGTLHKTGNGRLVLGGETLASGATAVLSVDAGRLQVKAKNALGAAQVAFTGTGILSVAPPTAETDADFARYGAILTAATPFIGNKAVVTVEGDAETLSETGGRVAVFTVAKSVADTLMVEGRKPAKGYRLTTEMVANAGEDTVTCWATYERSGLLFIVR